MSGLAWSGAFDAGQLRDVPPLPFGEPVEEWALGGATGKGIRVAIIDSGVDASHPLVGRMAGAVAVEADDEAEDGVRFVEGDHDDLVGHGTACAGIIRSIAPEADLFSVRVLGPNLKTRGSLFIAGIRWALDHGMDVVNMSLSSSSRQWFADLHEVADAAYFRNIMLVCAANNRPGPTYPSEYASVISVAAREGADQLSVAYNPDPPVEFGARGIDVEVAWSGGGTITASGNSFATPHIAGLVTLMKSKHGDLTSFQVKSVLQALADNTG